MQEQYIIIVAGGTGSRMKSDLPKQFIELEGVPVIIRTILCFLEYNSSMRVIICVHKNYKEYLENLVRKFDLKHADIQITFGGDSRFASVKNGLNLIQSANAVVGIHDAARPFVSKETIRLCYETAAVKGNAIPSVAVNESLRNVSNDLNKAVDRNEYKIVQTPQCFIASRIKKAFEQEYNSLFTDDATVLESVGEKIILVEGNVENIKITSPYDLVIAKALLSK